MRHVITALVENRSGVLARVAGLFSARGFNIDSLAVGETEDPTVSRMTIVTRGDDRTLEQIKKQLNKLIDVISVKDLKKGYFERELLLFRVEVNSANKARIAGLLEKNNAKILSFAQDHLTVEFAGDEEHTLKLMEGLKEYGVKDMSRTGKIALAKEE